MREIASRDRRRWATDEVHTSALVALAQPGDVLVIDAGGRLDVTPWGSNVARQALRRGLSGTIIDGACRDTEEILEMGYPMFVRGRTLRHSHGVFYSTCVNSEAVQIGLPPAAVMVCPGDLVMADDDGIVIIPAERTEEILALATKRHSVDERMHELLEAGSGPDDPELANLMHQTHQLEGLHALPERPVN